MSDVYRKFCFTVLIVFLGFNCDLKAQVELKSSYELLDESQEKDALIEYWKTTITFERSKSGGMPVVKETDLCRIVPLQNNLVMRHYFVSSHKQITDYKFYAGGSGRKSIKPVIGDSNTPGIFQSDSKYYYFSRNIKPSDQYGKFEVKSTTDDLRFYTRAYMADMKLFTAKREVEVLVPAWLDMRVELYNSDHVDLTCEVDSLPDGDVLYRYTGRNLNAPFQSDYFPGYANVHPHLLFLYNRYRTVDGEWKPILENVDQLYKWYKEMRGPEQYDLEKFKAISSDVVSGASNQLDSIKKVFYWVQDKIRYIAFEQGIDGFCPQNALSVYENKYGDCKGMSNLLKAMLTSLGYDARLAWLGTQDLPYTYKEPSIAVDNHMICVLYQGKRKYYLDATEKYLKLGETASRINGKEILIENGNSFVIDTVRRSAEDISSETYHYQLKLKGNNLSGKLKFQLQGEAKRHFYMSLSQLSRSEQEKNISELMCKEDNLLLDSLSALPATFDRDSNLSLTGIILKNNALRQIADERYIGIANLMPEINFDKDTSKSRHIRFSQVINQLNETTLEIPESMELCYLPKPLVFEFDDAFYRMEYLLDGNLVKFKSHLYIPYKIYKQEQIKDLAKLFDYQHKSRKQKIILKEKNR